MTDTIINIIVTIINIDMTIINIRMFCHLAEKKAEINLLRKWKRLKQEQNKKP